MSSFKSCINCSLLSILTSDNCFKSLCLSTLAVGLASSLSVISVAVRSDSTLSIFLPTASSVVDFTKASGKKYLNTSLALSLKKVLT